jgi:hypothetical protein
MPEITSENGPCYVSADNTCTIHGGLIIKDDNTALESCQTTRVLADVRAERARQFAQYGSNADLEDGTGTSWLRPFSPAPARTIERGFRDDYEERERWYGKPTWTMLVREEVAEVFQETDPVKLREELVQVAALAVSWIEKIDARQLAEEN